MPSAGTGLLSILRRHAFLFVAVAVLGTACTVALILSLPVRYTATASVALDSRKSKTEALQSVTSPLISGVPSDEVVVRTELEFLRAPPLIERTVETLDLGSRPEFNGSNPTLLDRMRRSLSALVHFLTHALNQAPAAPTNSDPLAQVVRSVRERVAVRNQPGSYVIEVAFTSSDPTLAAAVANTIVNLYMDDQRRQKTSDAHQAAEWLGDRLSEVQAKLQDSERKVREFQQANGLGEVRGTTALAQQIYDVNGELAAASAARQQAEAALEQARKGDAGGAIPIVTSPLLQKLHEQEAEVARRVADLETSFGNAYPALVSARASLKDTREKIAAETGRIVRSLAADAAAARQKESGLKGRLVELENARGMEGNAEAKLQQLKADASSTRSLYMNLLEQYREVAAQAGVQRPDTRMVSQAKVPLQPSEPDRKLLSGSAALLWISLAGLLILARDRSRRAFVSAHALEAEMSLRVLGMMPEAEGRVPVVDKVFREPAGVYCEALRGVSGKLQSNLGGPPGRVVLVTSSIPEEGKTVLAISLARHLTIAGWRTLLIDADVRRPSVERELRRSESALADSGEFDGAHLTVDKITGLDCVTREPLSLEGDVAALLNGDHLAATLRKVRYEYNYVIVDGPPILAVSDTARLAAQADATLLLVRWERTPRTVVANALKALRDGGVACPTAVLSRVNFRKHFRYCYGDRAYVMTRHAARYLARAK